MNIFLFKVVLIQILTIWHPNFATAGEARIYRDGWGVPHIYGTTSAEVMYGLGYAQAQDRLPSILKNYLSATGEMASVFGPAFINQDFRQRIWRHGAISRRGIEQLDPKIQLILKSYVSGIASYMSEHTRSIPKWAFEPEPYHVLALARYIFWQELEKQASEELQGRPTSNVSNHWVVSKERSAENAVMLLADPHGEWGKDTDWHESHLHGGELRAFGFTAPGLPFPIFGHNDRLGWSALAGGSDGVDIYEITFRSADSIVYKYGKGWKSAVGDTVLIQVMVNGKLETHLRRTLNTVHGPVIEREGRRGYAYRIAIYNEIRQIEQLYRQITAQNLQAFFSALGLAQMSPQRILYGDVEGNTFYIRTGRIAVRQEVFEWNQPVPGDSPIAVGSEIHNQEDLIQAINPPQGWIQDCGTSPDLVMSYSPLTPDRYSAYIYNIEPNTESGRSYRSRQVLETITRMTLQEALDLSTDTYVVYSERWLRALDIAFASHGLELADKHPRLSKGLGILRGWSGRADKEEIGMTLYARWMKFCRGKEIGVKQILSGQRLGPTTRRGLVEAFGQATEDMFMRDGRLEVPWGEINRIRQGTKSWGVSGSSGWNLESMRMIQTRSDLSINYGISGQSATTLMVFRAPGKVESFSVVPFGHSKDPTSHHSWDQAEALFSEGRLKPNHFGSKAGLRLEKSLEID
jgi:acyl-homoserine-lactone acylase